MSDHVCVQTASPEPASVTPERRRHANEIVFIDGAQRVQGALAGLRRSGEIDDSHVAAAERWYRDWVMGVERASDPAIRRSGKAADAHSGMLARVAALARCGDVRRCLGTRAETRLRMIVLEELSFSEAGRRLMPGDVNSRKKIAAQTVLLLEMLAEHYHTHDQARRERVKRSKSDGIETFMVDTGPGRS